MFRLVQKARIIVERKGRLAYIARQSAPLLGDENESSIHRREKALDISVDDDKKVREEVRVVEYRSSTSPPQMAAPRADTPGVQPKLPGSRSMTAAYAGMYSPAWSLSRCEVRTMSRFFDTTGEGTFLLRSLTGTRVQ
jgi:hypothetical protein